MCSSHPGLGTVKSWTSGILMTVSVQCESPSKASNITRTHIHVFTDLIARPRRGGGGENEDI